MIALLSKIVGETAWMFQGCAKGRESVKITVPVGPCAPSSPFRGVLSPGSARKWATELTECGGCEKYAAFPETDGGS